MTGQTIVLGSERAAQEAVRVIIAAPSGSVLTVKPPKRTLDQNSRFWAMLSDVSRAKPGGRSHPPHIWKAIFMNACAYPVQFEQGLSGEPFPLGFRSSELSKTQMSELMDFIDAWGSENGVPWSEPAREEAA